MLSRCVTSVSLHLTIIFFESLCGQIAPFFQSEIMVNYDPAFLLGMGLTTHSTEVRGSELPTSGIRQIAPIRGREKETALAETRQSTVSAHAIGLYNSDEDIRGL